MTLLPAVVPEIPEARGGIVPARLARKVGPLFGVRWEHSPYGLTWVSDYTRLTVSEIARGAPAPTRGEAGSAELALDAGQWQVLNRAVITHRPPTSSRPEPLPNEIANATLNRFGPDTKAAVILTAANTLLDPVTAAITEALLFLERRPTTALLPARVRVGAWASLVLEAYRSQPALFAAACQAREVQRAMTLGWQIPTMRDRIFARVEVGGSEPRSATGSAASPVSLAVADDTITAVQLAGSSGDHQLSSVQIERLRAELTRRWLDRLVTLGTVAGEGFLWLSDDGDGHRSVEAFAPHDPTLWSFLAEIEPLLPTEPDAVVPTGIGPQALAAIVATMPQPAEMASMDLLTRRSLVLALLTLIRLAFNSGSPDPASDMPTLLALDELSVLLGQVLAPEDPVRAVTRCRLADIRLELVRQDATYDSKLGPAVDGLLAALKDCLRLVEAGVVKGSDAAELIRSGNVELMALLRRHTPANPVPGVLAPDALLHEVDQLWKAMLAQMQIDLDQLHRQPPEIQYLIGYQLHDYATYLGGLGSAEDARTAVALYRDFVVPARQEYYRQTGYFQPLLYSYQNATRATTRLADLAAAAGDTAAARHHAEQGRAWIEMAFQAPYTTDILERALSDATDEVCRFALLVAPALLRAVQYASSASDPSDLERCGQLLDQAKRFAHRYAKDGRRYAREDELFELTRQLERLRSHPPRD